LIGQIEQIDVWAKEENSMKKNLSVLMVLVLGLVLSGCDNDSDDGIGGSGSTTTSQRFDHYNSDAWDGRGVAIVMCRGDRRTDSCSINGTPMALHGSQDHGRDVWSIPNTKTISGGTITCKRGGETINFKVNGGGMTWGSCGKG